MAALPTKCRTASATLPPPAKVMRQTPLLVTVLTARLKLVQQLSITFVGASKLQLEPQETVLLVAQFRVKQGKLVVHGTSTKAASPTFKTGMLRVQAPLV